ncbi:TPR repeat-containing protein [Tieghemostelium lacteum]|uniref:TPR repeat-containing protein n=1 Tax=Tieghemostelium lacteum TaxID=361077 RepID=A0A151ZG36_TIELA|nr:TPR repeat-containing protein [Tieghemostelium lacteum]|eukprot:KYQ92942.1 TPR repeat-containing protein [Tieghemostelium lacteum]
MGCCGSKNKYDEDYRNNDRSQVDKLEQLSNINDYKSSGQLGNDKSTIQSLQQSQQAENPTSAFQIISNTNKSQVLEKYEDYPDDPDNMVSYGIILSMEGKNKEAEAQLKKAVQKDSERARSWQAYAELYERQNDQQKALEIYGEGYKHSSPKIALDGDDSNLLLNYAINLYKAKDFEKAEKLFKRVITSGPKSAEACGRYAIFLLKVNQDKAKAETYFQEAANMEPPNAIWNQRYAEFCKHFLKDEEKASIYFKRSSLYQQQQGNSSRRN